MKATKSKEKIYFQGTKQCIVQYCTTFFPARSDRKPGVHYVSLQSLAFQSKNTLYKNRDLLRREIKDFNAPQIANPVQSLLCKMNNTLYMYENKQMAGGNRARGKNALFAEATRVAGSIVPEPQTVHSALLHDFFPSA